MADNLLNNKAHTGYTTYAKIENGVTISQHSNSLTKKWTDFRNGSKNPLHRAQVRNHQSATTTSSGSRRRFDFGSGSASVSYSLIGHPDQLGYETASGYELMDGLDQFGVVNPSNISSSSADTQARIKFFKKYREATRAFQGGNFFGELRETLQMIRHPAQSIRQGLDLYYRRAKKHWIKRGPSLKEKVGIIQDTWLEVSFGWRPLLNDVDDAMKALADIPTGYYTPLSSQATNISASTTWHANGGSSVGVFYQGTDYDISSVRYKGECKADCLAPAVRLPSRWGFSPDNWMPTLWEVTPYSFLVDYFTNVGDVIDGWGSMTTGCAWINRTERVERKRLNSGYLVQDAYYKLLYAGRWRSSSASYSGYENSCVNFSRTAVNNITIGLNDLEFRCPGVSSTKWLNIAALANIHTLQKYAKRG